MKGHKTSYVTGNLEKQIVGLVRDITGNLVVQKKGLIKEQSQSIISKNNLLFLSVICARLYQN